MASRVSAMDGMAQKRPTVVSVAAILGVGIQLVSIPFFFAPGADEIPGFAIVIGIVMGLLTLVGCWGMWNLHRWGAILTLVVTFLNTLTAIPGLTNAPSGWILAELIVLLPLSVLTMVLIALPVSWRAYRRS